MFAIRSKALGLGVAAWIGLVATASVALGQVLPYDLPPLIPNEPFTVFDHPNVPDAQGCVKQCVRDASPCDPPSYKRADNRCSSVN